MGLSSNTIIHFTRNKSSLAGILKETFKVKYCHETISNLKGTHEFLVPIVSFSDIPFSQILNHINSYGCYGLGLSKSWAKSKGLNPVLYLDNHSTLTKNILYHTPRSLLIDSKAYVINHMESEHRQAFDFIRYVKNYQGDLNRIGKKTISNYRFSDEREWRYSIDPIKPNVFFASINGFNTDKLNMVKEKLNKSIEDERLRFTPKDINYIIVKKEVERDAIIGLIEKTKNKFSFSEVKRLSSRIISTEQLKTDF